MKKLLFRIYAVLKSYFDQDTKPYPCIESTVEFSVDNYIIRAWINEETVGLRSNSKFKDFAFENKHLEFKEFIEKLATFENLNAVHVRDALTNDGNVLYVVWP